MVCKVDLVIFVNIFFCAIFCFIWLLGKDLLQVFIRVSHENMFFKKKLAQPAPQVFGGCFEGIQKDF